MILEFDNIQFSYDDRPLLSGVYVKCETGKVTGLLGRNGTGKSTLLKIVFGSKSIEMLSVRVDKKVIAVPAFSGKIISYLPQQSFVPRDMSLYKILNLYKIDPAQLLDQCPELEEDLPFKAGALSGGKLRFFEVLLILNSEAPFCFLDEPFTGLAPVMIERLKEQIKNGFGSKGILITDHLYKNVIELADDLYVLSNGKTYPVKTEDQLIERGYLWE